MRLFEFGRYSELQMSDKADVPALAALASLLSPLLKAAPRGVINQAPLAVAFEQVLNARGVSARASAPQAEIAAGRARCALSHLRKLFQQPILRAQRSKKATAQELAALQSLADLYRPGADGHAPKIPASWSGSSSGESAILPLCRASSSENSASRSSLEGACSPERVAPPSHDAAAPASAASEQSEPAAQSLEPPRRAKTLGRVPSASDSPFDKCVGGAIAVQPQPAGPSPFAQRDAVNIVLDIVCRASFGATSAGAAAASAPLDAAAASAVVADAARAAAGPAGFDAGLPVAVQAARAPAAARAAAAVAASAAPALQATSSQAPSAAARDAYHMMTYRATGACACRVVGGRQLFQVRVPGDILESRRIAEGGRSRLLAGEPLESVRTWLNVEKSKAVAAAQLPA